MLPSRYFDLFLKGVRRPSDAIEHLLTETKANRLYRAGLDLRYDLYRRRRNIKLQKSLIEELVDSDEFVLVILDACRYDYFAAEYSEFFQGNLMKVWSAGNNTPNWVANTWTNQYDLTYVSATVWLADIGWESAAEKEPLISASNHGYRPSRHISDRRDVWLHQWDATRFTVTPDNVTEAALGQAASVEDTRMVVHYLQPHRPYIGDPNISPWEESVDEGDIERADEGVDLDEIFEHRSTVTLEDIYRYDLGWTEFAEYELDFPRFNIRKAFEEGELTAEFYQEAYRGNLRLVFESVVRLVENLDCPVFITADHGELLGEEGDVLHPNFTQPTLREVPWFEVESTLLHEDQINDISTEERGETPEFSNYGVEERLKQLGYLRD